MTAEYEAANPVNTDQTVADGTSGGDGTSTDSADSN